MSHSDHGEMLSVKPEENSTNMIWILSESSRWSVDDVCRFLTENGLGYLQSIFKDNDISGDVLASLNEFRLEKMGITSMGKRMKILKLLNPLSERHNQPEWQYKIFNDPIHGHIELHPLCVRVVDTPQFQRLRNIKQLGGCYFVFPGASTNRFEHSIGVCHLAGELARALQARQPELGITDLDVLCVELAGLCHDLGHGPFSHLFDDRFMPKIRPERRWKHEEASVKMFDYLVEANNLTKLFDEYGVDEINRTFIKEQIAGPATRSLDPKDNKKIWPYIGRGESKGFLYEIVANKRNGIDVDKWDYFARDCHHLGIRNSFDHCRFMKFARVLEVDGEMQICSRDKEVGNLYDLFYTRAKLHRAVYQHKTGSVVETMISEAFMKANDFIRIPGKDGKLLRLSETVDDMVAYTKLTDHIFYEILYSTRDELIPAREILEMMQARQLYTCIGQTNTKHRNFFKEDQKPEIVTGLVNILSDQELQDRNWQRPLPDNLVIQIVTLDYGMSDKNPIDYVRFYMKNSPTKAIQVRKDQVSQMLPDKFAEQYIRIYSKRRDQSALDVVALSFVKWCDKNGFPQPKGGDLLTSELTPVKLATDSPTTSKRVATRLNFDNK